jgi:hypothetical protein
MQAASVSVDRACFIAYLLLRMNLTTAPTKNLPKNLALDPKRARTIRMGKKETFNACMKNRHNIKKTIFFGAMRKTLPALSLVFAAALGHAQDTSILAGTMHVPAMPTIRSPSI